MNATLPAYVCPPTCHDCRLRKTGAFTAVKPEVLDFIEGFRTDSLAVEAGGALVRENQTNASPIFEAEKMPAVVQNFPHFPSNPARR